MIIKINFRTRYTFSATVPRLVQTLMMYPTECYNQKIESCEISTSVGEVTEVPRDALGHKIFNIYNKNISEPQIITMKSIVETKNTFGVMKGLRDLVNPDCFLRQTALTEPNKRILNLIGKTTKKNSIEYCHTLNETVSESIEYLPGTTNIFTSATDAISQGTGVCQDFSHILIGLARFHGYPARYVNGFLLDDTDIASNDTHAWCEIFIENLGWVGFDPCHKKCIDDKYVRVGCGYDFSYTSMIKGVKSNYDGDESLEHKLSVQSQVSQ